MERLKIFYTVAQVESFTKAAEILHLTQPAISIQIKALEKEYGTKLFERIGKKVFLTEAGKRLYQYTEKILSLLEEAKISLKEFENPFLGTVNFGVSLLVGVYIIPQIIGAFKKLYPQVNFSIKVRYAAEIIKMVEKNEIDFGIIGESGEEVFTPFLDIEPLMKDKFLFITGSNLSLKDSISAEEVVKEKLILPERYSATRKYIDKKFLEKNLIIVPYLEIGNIEAVKKLVEEEFGVSILSLISIKEELRSGRLKGLEIRDLKLERNILLIKRQGKTLFPASRLFLAFLKEQIQNLL